MQVFCFKTINILLQKYKFPALKIIDIVLHLCSFIKLLNYMNDSLQKLVQSTDMCDDIFGFFFRNVCFT